MTSPSPSNSALQQELLHARSVLERIALERDTTLHRHSQANVNLEYASLEDLQHKTHQHEEQERQARTAWESIRNATLDGPANMV